MFAIVKLLGGIRATVFAVLAVAAIIAFLWFRGAAAAADSRAATAEQRAEAAEGQVRALKESARRDAVANEATNVARDSAAKRQPIQEARAAKVKSYADSAVDRCVADPRIVSELRAGEDRVRRAASRLRGDGPAESAAADDSDH